MNVTLPKKHHLKKRTLLVYGIAIAVCIIAIVIVVSIQVLGDDVTNKIFGITKLSTKTDEQEGILKAEFDGIFQNQLDNDTNKTLDNLKKIDNYQDLVYTGYQKKENELNHYDINVQIPYFNIDNEITKKYNEEIKAQFEEFAESALKIENQNIIYTVEYQAYIENDVLSVIIRSNLKRGASAQRVIVLTYNFDIVNQKEVTLSDMIQKCGLNENSVQSKIKTDIKKEEEKVEELKELGYPVYQRDVNSDFYEIENSKQFFVHNQNLYIIYAYGNEALTSEMDLVIL